MVCSVTTQTTNATATSTIKAIQLIANATTTPGHLSTVKLNVQSTVNLTYECYSNQTIRLVGSDFVKSSKSLIITSGNSSSRVNCTGKKDISDGFLIEGKDCFNILLRGDLTSENDSNIIGGRHFTAFTFECKGLPKNGTIKTVTVKVALQIQRYTIRCCDQSIFTVTDNKNNTKVSFTDGDEEVLHIKGPGEYYMYLQECIAFNGTSVDSSKTNHTLYKNFKYVTHKQLKIIQKF
ncbi:hypothetical protein ACJMK2_027246 [Sinanodonta woodiana]|uniref:Uncharacterized protein n=1 Tax=Sinanodonta woodiana TaxID=1069815 RepID=A0ABD3XM24_SINWO